MTPTEDAQAILDKSRTSFGYEIDGKTLIDQHGGYMLQGNGGFMLFVLSEPGVYKVTAGFDEDSRGTNAIAEMNAGYAWLFENTDAERTIARVSADDKATISLAPHIYGAELIREGDVVTGEITRKRWQAARPK
jgi:hypothetical protein